MKASRYEEALDCYSKAVKMDPTNAMYYCNRWVTGGAAVVQAKGCGQGVGEGGVNNQLEVDQL